MDYIKYPKLLPKELMGSELNYEEEVYGWEVVVSEKIHGTNSGIYVSKEGEVGYGTRLKLLSEEEVESKNYYQKELKNIVDIEWYKEEGQKLAKRKGYDYVIFYGELFGSKVFNMGYEQVKSGIKDYKVFSILGVISKEEGYKEVEKISYDEMTSIMGLGNLVPIEYRGIYKDAISEDVSGIEKESNYGGVREGYVVMPTRAIVYRYSGLEGNTYYPIYGMKIKGEEFKEVSGKVKKETKIRGKAIRGLDGRYHELLKGMYSYCTRGRIENVISHMGTSVSTKDIPKITEELIKDIGEEYVSEGYSDYEKGIVLNKLRGIALKEVAMYIKGEKQDDK